MRAFRFSLQRVLDVKRIVEEQRRHAVLQAQADVDACAHLLEQTEAARRAAAAGTGTGRGAVDPDMLSLGWQHRAALYGRRLALEAELAEKTRVLDRARVVLLGAVKERRALERVAEKRRAAHELAMARLDQVVLDDLAGTRAARARREAGPTGE